MLFWGKKKKRLPDIIVGFVLLESLSYDFNKLKINLKKEWKIEIKDTAVCSATDAKETREALP